jgi:ABC-type multidrug transport system permease subunit
VNVSVGEYDSGWSAGYPGLRAGLRNGWMAVWASFWQHWKTTTANFWSLSFFIGSVPQVAIYAWIAVQSPDPAVLAYLIVGAPLMAIWHSVFFGISSSLNSELRGRTIEFTMISRTSILVVLFGKALAMMLFGVPAGLVAVVTMFIVARQAPHIASYPYLFGSVAFIFLGLAVTGLVMAPVTALTRGRMSGMYTPLLPIIVTLSGFLFPISSLPLGLEIASRILPSSWAMSSVMQAIKGPESFWAVASGWVYCLALSVFLLAVTFLLFKAVEKRLRITGIMPY